MEGEETDNDLAEVQNDLDEERAELLQQAEDIAAAPEAPQDLTEDTPMPDVTWFNLIQTLSSPLNSSSIDYWRILDVHPVF